MSTVSVARKENVVNSSIYMYNQRYLCSASLINSSVLLPTAVVLNGRSVGFTRTDTNSANTFTIIAASGETIGGSPTVLLNVGATMEIIAFEGNWYFTELW